MNWLQIIQLLLELFRRRAGVKDQNFQAGSAAAASQEAADKAEFQSVAAQLQAFVDAPKVGAAPGSVAHDGGVIQHIRDLIAALQSGDWEAIKTAIFDVLGHL